MISTRAPFVYACLMLLAMMASVGQAAELNREDLSAFLDGLIPTTIERADIAGAVVVVVRDDRILLARGYGHADVDNARPVDPNTTLFRIASISKPVTATAVMQLVEQGKLNLDQDVNTYLDFRIPPTFDTAITLRHLLTHTAGFEESVKDLFAADACCVLPLADVLKKNLPRRVAQPGELIAYSNYGLALAGYIVERVAGMPFHAYAATHIFAPLGMSSTTYEQPLPQTLAPQVSQGYLLGSKPPIPFEIVQMYPAGGISTTGADLARFMIAHLSQTTGVLRPATLRLMHEKSACPAGDAGHNCMALAFWREDRNGQRILSHAGDIAAFHSYMHLVPDAGVGLFFAVNSAGNGNNYALRSKVFRAFLDRYFPHSPSPLSPSLPLAEQHGMQLAGHYLSTRRSETNFRRLRNLLAQPELHALPNGEIEFDTLIDQRGLPIRWREVAPYTWQDIASEARLVAVRDDRGQLQYLTTDDFPAVWVYQRAAWFEDKAVVLPVLACCVLILSVSVVLGLARSFGAFTRYFESDSDRSKASWLMTAGVSAAYLLALFGWYALTQWVTADADFNDTLDARLRTLQVLGITCVVGTALVSYRTALLWRRAPRQWVRAMGHTLLTAACITLATIGLTFHLLAVPETY